MNISQILSPQTTFCNIALTSKKKVLEKVSEVMAEFINCSAQDVFESLFARERLGSTALGHGIAIPHGRINSCNKPIAVFILLDKPVDYDAPDGQLIDIIFAILVPEQADNQQLKCLAEIAKVLSNPTLVSQIRNAHCSDALYDILEKATLKVKAVAH